MKHSAEDYANPRIDGQATSVSALEGRVGSDPLKIIWVGAMLALGTIGSVLTASWGAVIVFCATTILTLCLGHSIGMHRRFIHRSFDCPKLLEYLFVHFGVLVGLAGPLGMLKTHDLRDWAQRQAECHDYFAHRQVWYRDLWWQLFCTIELKHPPYIQVEEAIASDRVYYWMERTWMLQQMPWAALLFWFGGWGWVFWGIGSRVSVSVLGHWFVGYFAHNTGAQDWHVTGAAVQGYNVPWTALLTMGEGWHNNHHAYPGSAKLGIEEGQWDPGWWVLKLLQKMRLISNIVTPDLLGARSDLKPLVEGVR